jgi:superfamily II DNA or RNA helicase
MNLKIQIQFTPVYCNILTPLPIEDERVLHETLAYHPNNYFFSIPYQNGNWDGFNRMYNSTKHRFRSGLLDWVSDLLQALGYDIEVLGKPEFTEFVQQSFTYTLRPYQIQSVNAILLNRFGILQSPPRSGKTTIAAAVIDSERKFPTIFFCRSIDLAHQTVGVLQKLIQGVTIGIVGDGEVNICDVTVVTIQSAYYTYNKKYDVSKKEKEEKDLDVEDKIAVRFLIESSKIVFMDEAHEVSGNSCKFILDKCINVELKVGLTATPFEGEEEDVKIEEIIGSVFYKIGFSTLIRDGYLLRPTIYMYKLPKLKLGDLPYISMYKRAVAENEFLNQLIKNIVEVITSYGHSIVIQTEYRNHSKALAAYLNVPYLIGQGGPEKETVKREELLRQLRDKEILCLVSTVIEQGIDVRSLNYTINLVGGTRFRRTFQRIRSITPDEAKQTCGVIDFYFQCKYLDKHSKLRKKFYLSEPEFIFEERDVSRGKI